MAAFRGLMRLAALLLSLSLARALPIDPEEHVWHGFNRYQANSNQINPVHFALLLESIWGSGIGAIGV